MTATVGLPPAALVRAQERELTALPGAQQPAATQWFPRQPHHRNTVTVEHHRRHPATRPQSTTTHLYMRHAMIRVGPSWRSAWKVLRCLVFRG
jgi:hypothetical protein